MLYAIDCNLFILAIVFVFNNIDGLYLTKKKKQEPKGNSENLVNPISNKNLRYSGMKHASIWTFFFKDSKEL